MFFRHHLQVFLSEVVSKKSSKLVKFKNLFNPNVTPPPSSFFLGGGVKKNSNKKSQSTRAKCTSDLAWSVQTRSEIVRNCLKRVKSCPKLAKESQKRAKKESKKRQKTFSPCFPSVHFTFFEEKKSPKSRKRVENSQRVAQKVEKRVKKSRKIAKESSRKESKKSH